MFGVTDHAYIVFTANAFALLGLRPLYFLVSGLLDRLVYLSTGLALILAFIGVKLVLEFDHWMRPKRSRDARFGFPIASDSARCRPLRSRPGEPVVFSVRRPRSR